MNNENKRGRKAKEIDRNNIFSVRLRKLIEETESKQQDVADNIGVSRQALNKWVNGETVPDIFSAAKIADYFDVSTDYMTGRTDIKSKNEDIKTLCRITGLSEKAISELNYFKDIPKIKNENTKFYSELHKMIFYSFLAIDGFKSNFYDSEYLQNCSLKEIMQHAEEAIYLFVKYYHNTEENYKHIKYEMKKANEDLNELSRLLKKMKISEISIEELKNSPDKRRELVDGLIKLIEKGA